MHKNKTLFLFLENRQKSSFSHSALIEKEDELFEEELQKNGVQNINL